MAKQLVVLLISALLALCLAGCGSSDSAQSSTSASEESEYLIPAEDLDDPVKMANYFLDYQPYSRAWLIDELVSFDFTPEQAEEAADSCGADWNEQAVRYAHYISGEPGDYKRLDDSAMNAYSAKSLLEVLISAGFTEDEAKYGVENCGFDWNAMAKRWANNYLTVSASSRDELIEHLEWEGFTHEQAVKAADKLGL